MNKLAAVGSVVLIAVSAFLAGRYTGKPTSQGSPKAKHILYYIDPMHPAYKSDKPGIAPDCGMELVPVYADGVSSSPDPSTGSAPPGMVMISPEKQRMLGIRALAAEKTSGTRTLRTLGRVAVDETRVFR